MKQTEVERRLPDMKLTEVGRLLPLRKRWECSPFLSRIKSHGSFLSLRVYKMKLTFIVNMIPLLDVVYKS